MVSDARQCLNCGAWLERDVRFCDRCGAPVAHQEWTGGQLSPGSDSSPGVGIAFVAGFATGGIAASLLTIAAYLTGYL